MRNVKLSVNREMVRLILEFAFAVQDIEDVYKATRGLTPFEWVDVWHKQTEQLQDMMREHLRKQGYEVD